MATLGELLEIDYKSKSMSLTELSEALRRALSLPVIKRNSSLQSSITAVTTALTLYTSLVSVYEVILAAMPAIKTASKAAAIPLNPSMATEVAQDVVVMLQTTLMSAAKETVISLKENLLNMDVPGT